MGGESRNLPALSDACRAIETWDLAAIAAHWERPGVTSLRAKTVALVTLCTRLCSLAVEPGAAVLVLQYLAPRVRALLRRMRMRPPRIGASKPGRLAVERVAEGWADLLAHVLQGLDRAASGCPDTMATRLWILFQAMRIHRTIVILEVQWGVSRCPGMWLRLHELQTYSNARIRPQLDAGSPPQRVAVVEAIAQTYREALLLGCALVHPPPRLLASPLARCLFAWARETRLLPAVRRDWSRGWWIVATGNDAPPWYLVGSLPDDWRGYRLELPAACREFLGSVAPSR